MTSELLIYGATVLAIWGIYGWRGRTRERRARQLLQEASDAKLLEPASLHPVINPNRCAGCAVCADACPEDGVLGIIDGKAQLVSPAHCIGHGACKTACPFDAITLVFGTETRGVDIPYVGDNFETNVPGVFIAGELGGMGLIRNAVEQGSQAVQFIAKRPRSPESFDWDLMIVGAGPAGFAATLMAKRLGLRALTIEQETLGGTVAHYPRGKIVMTAPVELPLYGSVKLRETTKEALLELWQDVEQQTGIEIRYRERLEALAARGDGFEIQTTRGSYRTRSVLLCIGRRGTPRKLGVPGEDSAKVVYRLTEPEQYRGRCVLVVGGGDSALEAATTLASEDGTKVTLSYRADAFTRAKPKNRERVQDAGREGALAVLLESKVLEIGDSYVRLEQHGREMRIGNHTVIVCAGGVLPTGLLTSVGIEVETRFGTA